MFVSFKPLTSFYNPYNLAFVTTKAAPCIEIDPIGVLTMKDPEEQAIQAELDKIGQTIDTILYRIQNLDPVKQEQDSDSKE
jgi:hypothetical protein